MSRERTNDDVLRLDDGLVLLYDTKKVEATLLDFEPVKLTTKNKIMKHGVVDLKIKNSPEKSTASIPYHGASGGTAEDDAQREAEWNHIGQNIAPQLNEMGYESFSVDGDINVSAYKPKPGVDPANLETKNSDFDLDIATLTNIALKMAGSGYVLSELHPPKRIVAKQRFEEDIWMNNQGGKGGDVDPASKAMRLVFVKRPPGMDDAATAAETERVLKAIPPLEPDEHIQHLGTPGHCQHGADHDPVPPAVVDKAADVTMSVRPLMTTDGVTGVRDSSLVYRPEELTPDAAKLRQAATRKFREHLTNALFEVAANDPYMTDEEKQKIRKLSYCKFVDYLQKAKEPQPDYSKKLIANPDVLAKHLKNWIKEPLYQAVLEKIQPNTPTLRNEHDVDELMPKLTKDVVNDISEKGIRCQVSGGYAPFVGINPRQAQLHAILHNRATMCVLTENGELTQAQVDSGSIKGRGHLHAKTQMRDDAEARNLIAFLHSKGVREAKDYKEDEEYNETFKLSEKLKELRSRVFDVKFSELQSNFRFDQDSLNISPAERLAEMALLPENADIACALADNPQVKPFVLQNIQGRINQGISGPGLTEADVAVLGGISGIPDDVYDSIVRQIVDMRSMLAYVPANDFTEAKCKYDSMNIAHVPAVASRLLDWINNSDQPVTPVIESLIEDKTTRDLVVEDLIARALVTAKPLAEAETKAKIAENAAKAAEKAGSLDAKQLSEVARAAEQHRVVLAARPIFTKKDLALINGVPSLMKRLAFKFSEIESPQVRVALLQHGGINEKLVANLKNRYPIMPALDKLVPQDKEIYNRNKSLFEQQDVKVDNEGVKVAAVTEEPTKPKGVVGSLVKKLEQIQAEANATMANTQNKQVSGESPASVAVIHMPVAKGAVPVEPSSNPAQSQKVATGGSSKSPF